MTESKLLRFAAVAVVLAAYLFVFRGGETHITERLDDNARIAERVRAGERTLASRPRFEAEAPHVPGKAFALEDVAAGQADLAFDVRGAEALHRQDGVGDVRAVPAD